MKKIVTLILSFLLMLSLGICIFATDSFDPTLDIVTSADGTMITVTMNNVPDGVLAELKITCKDWDNATVKDSSGKTMVSSFDTSDDTVSFAAVGGTYTITQKSTAPEKDHNYRPVGGATTDDKPDIKSPDTFDAGIALYVGLSVAGAVGTAMLGRKKED